MGIVVVFKSITYAQKAERILRRQGILAQVIKVSSVPGMNTCAHGVKIPNQSMTPALKILKAQGIPIFKVLSFYGNGSFSEIFA